MTDKIIQFPAPNKHRARITLSQQLRGIARLPKEDRPVMAQNLGRMAASIDRENPLRGAKVIFDSTWPNDHTKWAKRKRLLRLVGEDLGDPQDYGTYDAAGATYLRLAEAVARHSGPFKDSDALQREIERRVTEMLWGTSLRGNTTPLDDSAIDARNLLTELATAIQSHIAATGITRLWEILKTSPFSPRLMDKDNLTEDENLQLIPIHDRNGKIFNYHDTETRFDGHVLIAADWAYPRTQVGWLLKRVSGKMLILPDYICLNDIDADDPENPAVRQIEAWAREWNDEDPDEEGWAYPSHDYEEALGHGWVSADFDIIYLVQAHIVPTQDGAPELYLFLFCGSIDDFDQVIPASITGNLLRTKQMKQILEKLRYDRDGWVLRYGIFDCYPEFIWKADFGDGPFWASSPAEPSRINLDSRLKPGQILGLLDIPGLSDLDGNKMSLAEFAQGDAAEILIGSDQYRFVSILDEAAGVPAPCRTNSIAASMFRNAALEDTDARLSSLLERTARKLTMSGLEYHASLIEFYRSAIKQNGPDKAI